MILDTFESLDSQNNRLTKIKNYNDANELISIIESKEKNGTLKTIEEEFKIYLNILN